MERDADELEDERRFGEQSPALSEEEETTKERGEVR